MLETSHLVLLTIFREVPYGSLKGRNYDLYVSPLSVHRNFPAGLYH